MTDMTVASIILNQLGGARFTMMTGAKDYVASDDWLKFRLPARSTKNKCTHVRIILDPSDTYTMEFLKWNSRKVEMQVVSKYSNVYCDSMQDLFEEETGLLVHF